MGDVFLAVPDAMAAFSAAQHAAGATITSASSGDTAAALSEAFVAIGPLGAAHFHPAFALAYCINHAAGILVGRVHHALGEATTAATAAVVASDTA